MLVTLLTGLSYFTIGLGILTSILGLVRYRWLSPSLRWLALLATFGALMDIIATSINKLLHTSNLFLLPFVIVGELILLALAYRQALQSAAFSRALPWVLSLFSVYALLESVLQLGLVRHAVPLEIINCLLQLGLAGLYFQKLLNELRVEHLRADPFFWVSVALVVHGLGAVFISLSSNYILAHCSLQVQMIALWGLLNVFNILLYLAYCWALGMRPQPQALPLGA
ncbi:MAG: hypothetical protein ACRYFZ_23215 [Janthinobacterium lividum]